MLNILVGVKQVPDINLVKMDPVTGSLIRAGVPAILNPLDANALEAAVRVKEAHGGTVTVITMGPDMAKQALRECLAAGADRAVLLSDRAFANADTLATRYVIVTAAKMLGEFDLVFCGKESLDGATGQMGAQLAERFDASQISSMSRIIGINEAAKTVTAPQHGNNSASRTHITGKRILFRRGKVRKQNRVRAEGVRRRHHQPEIRFQIFDMLVFVKFCLFHTAIIPQNRKKAKKKGRPKTDSLSFLKIIQPAAPKRGRYLHSCRNRCRCLRR